MNNNIEELFLSDEKVDCIEGEYEISLGLFLRYFEKNNYNPVRAISHISLFDKRIDIHMLDKMDEEDPYFLKDYHIITFFLYEIISNINLSIEIEFTELKRMALTKNDDEPYYPRMLQNYILNKVKYNNISDDDLMNLYLVYKSAIKDGNPLGILVNGMITEKYTNQYDEAEKCYVIALESKVDEAIFNLSRLYSKGVLGEEKKNNAETIKNIYCLDSKNTNKIAMDIIMGENGFFQSLTFGTNLLERKLDELMREAADGQFDENICQIAYTLFLIYKDDDPEKGLKYATISCWALKIKTGNIDDSINELVYYPHKEKDPIELFSLIKSDMDGFEITLNKNKQTITINPYNPSRKFFVYLSGNNQTELVQEIVIYNAIIEKNDSIHVLDIEISEFINNHIRIKLYYGIEMIIECYNPYFSFNKEKSTKRNNKKYLLDKYNKRINDNYLEYNLFNMNSLFKELYNKKIEEEKALDNILAFIEKKKKEVGYISDSRVAEASHITRQTFSKIITKKINPSRKYLLGIVFALHMTIDEALDFLGCYGYTLSQSSNYDILLIVALEEHIYDIEVLNDTIEEEQLGEFIGGYERI